MRCWESPPRLPSPSLSRRDRCRCGIHPSQEGIFRRVFQAAVRHCVEKSPPLEKGGTSGGFRKRLGVSGSAFGNFHDNPVTLTEPELGAMPLNG